MMDPIAKSHKMRELRRAKNRREYHGEQVNRTGSDESIRRFRLAVEEVRRLEQELGIDER